MASIARRRDSCARAPQARIHPEQRAADLSEQQVGALREAMVAVPRIAVDVDADSSRFPEDWIFHHRWSEKKAPSHYSFIKIGGRVRSPFRAAGCTIQDRIQVCNAMQPPAS